MSQDKKKKAVPSWSPHPMPGMLEQTGPSAEAREQLIKEGIWQGDAPNRVVAQRGPLTPPAQEAEETSNTYGSDSAYSTGAGVAPHPASRTEPERDSSTLAREHRDSRQRFNESNEVAAMPSRHQQQSEADFFHASLSHQQPRGAIVAPTPTSAARQPGTSERAERRQPDATESVAPTPTWRYEPFDEGVAPTPRPRQRDITAGVASPPVSPRRQRQPDASAPAPPASPRRQRQPDANAPAPPASRRRQPDTPMVPPVSPDLSRPNEPYSFEAAIPLPRPRRGSAAVGKVQSTRAPRKHEADERVRRTLRVTVQVDQHLHALASLLGLDLNGALSVAIVEHHLYLLHRRPPTEG